MNNVPKRVAILGASRGLGASLSTHLVRSLSPEDLLFLVSRRQKPMPYEAHQNQKSLRVETICADFSRPETHLEFIKTLLEWGPTHIFYCAGGGPHGVFGQKNFEDHAWAFQVNFLCPARLIHAVLRNDSPERERALLQVTCVGSAIAEEKGDPLASSYAAAKSALRSLILSIHQEGTSLDLRLYSPGYMDTLLIPRNAWPRKQGGLLLSPDVVAQDLWDWSLKPHARNSHRIFAQDFGSM